MALIRGANSPAKQEAGHWKALIRSTSLPLPLAAQKHPFPACLGAGAPGCVITSDPPPPAPSLPSRPPRQCSTSSKGSGDGQGHPNSRQQSALQAVDGRLVAVELHCSVTKHCSLFRLGCCPCASLPPSRLFRDVQLLPAPCLEAALVLPALATLLRSAASCRGHRDVSGVASQLHCHCLGFLDITLDRMKTLLPNVFHGRLHQTPHHRITSHHKAVLFIKTVMFNKPQCSHDSCIFVFWLYDRVKT